MLKKVLLLILMFVLAQCVVYASQKTIAVVNNEPIFEDEYNDMLKLYMERYNSLPKSQQTPEARKVLENMAFDSKVNSLIIKQEVKKQNIKVSEKEIEDELIRLKGTFESDAQFKEVLKKQGLTLSKIREQLKEDLAAQKLLRQAVGNKIKSPSDSQCKAFFEKVQKKIKNPDKKFGSDDNEEELITRYAIQVKRLEGEKVAVRQIFVRADSKANSSELKKAETKVEKIKSELKAGKGFANVAKQYSDDPQAKTTGGSMGMVAKGDYAQNPNIERAIFSLEVGRYTKEPVKSNIGFHFFRIEGKEAARDTAITFDELKSQIKSTLMGIEEEKAIAEYYKGLKNKAVIRDNR